jgi:hypothetical protein
MTQKNQITITVSGLSGTGKTAIAQVIALSLSSAGMTDVTIDYGEDGNPHRSDQCALDLLKKIDRHAAVMIHDVHTVHRVSTEKTVPTYKVIEYYDPGRNTPTEQLEPTTPPKYVDNMLDLLRGRSTAPTSPAADMISVLDFERFKTKVELIFMHMEVTPYDGAVHFQNKVRTHGLVSSNHTFEPTTGYQKHFITIQVSQGAYAATLHFNRDKINSISYEKIT